MNEKPTPDPQIDRQWIEEFTGMASLRREFVIREREGNHFEIFQTSPEEVRGVMAALTIDEVIGYFAIAILRGRNSPFRSVEQERAWIAQYGRWGSHAVPPPALQPWQKLLPERCSA